MNVNHLSKTIALAIFMLTLSACYRPVYYPYNNDYGGQGSNYGGYPNPGYGSNYPNAQYPQGQYDYGHRHSRHDHYDDGDDYRDRRREWRQYRDDD